MPEYDGFSIVCGCRCRGCGNKVRLEGHADANGTHYCPNCDNYVHTQPGKCRERTPDKTAARQKAIDDAGIK